MSKILEKSLKDARKEGGITVGSKQVLQSIKDSKLVVLSKSLKSRALEQIGAGAKEAGVPTVAFGGTSVALGKLCGLQFRTSTISFTSLDDGAIKSIIKDMADGEEDGQ